MDEFFLHYIWRYQKFNGRSLTLTDNQPLVIFETGYYNQDSGPDFEEARIKIGEVEWAGQVEIHIRSSDWYKHQHQSNAAYYNVILHVVWEDDTPVTIENERIPTLCLKNWVSPEETEKYKNYLNSPEDVLCESSHHQVNEITKSSMLDRVLIERLEQKATTLLTTLKNSNNDWESTTYVTLCSNFGFSTNKPAFERLAQLLPYSILKKELHNLLSTEALLFGQAGFLHLAEDRYQQQLSKEYVYLRQKYRLPEPMSLATWKLGRMRPANFPPLRIAQLASMLHKNPKLFALLIHEEDPNTIIKQLNPNVEGYWSEHYHFGKKGKKEKKPNTMGNSSLQNICINTLAPMYAAYKAYTGDEKYMQRAMDVLETLPAENNRITRKVDFLQSGKKTSAFDSQALIQLYKNYCSSKRCLHCNIGLSLIHR